TAMRRTITALLATVVRVAVGLGVPDGLAKLASADGEQAAAAQTSTAKITRLTTDMITARLGAVVREA
ncbi:MAG TPA: hypothetical protein VEN31_07185, partial [Candidatus Bathyarchaeia archaeon]|nr:hypothetical protein [Candidatus Bathyarchaeia archaeon]